MNKFDEVIEDPVEKGVQTLFTALILFNRLLKCWGIVYNKDLDGYHSVHDLSELEIIDTLALLHAVILFSDSCFIAFSDTLQGTVPRFPIIMHNTNAL